MVARRAVITGIGLIGPTGVGHAPFWDAVRAGRSAIGRLRRFDPALTPCRVAGEVEDEALAEHVDPRKRRTTTRASQLAMVAAELAMSDARLPQSAIASDAFGVMVGTALGGWTDGEQQAAISSNAARQVNPFRRYRCAESRTRRRSGWGSSAHTGPAGTFSSGCPRACRRSPTARPSSSPARRRVSASTEAPLSPVASRH
jgi:3-oxoacyl-(acyl-carrier-protein) synthase